MIGFATASRTVMGQAWMEEGDEDPAAVPNRLFQGNQRPGAPGPNTPAPGGPRPGGLGAAEPQVGRTTTKPSNEPPIKVDAFEQLQVDESLADKHAAIARMLRDGFAGGDQAVFDAFYNTYSFPRWTVPANIALLPTYRIELSRDLKVTGESGLAARTHLLDLALANLQKLATGKYHPVVRNNAMLAIGELAVQGAGASGGSRSTQPLPAALPVMLEAVKSADQIDAVKVAALIGIYRHAVLGIANSQQRDQEVVPAMLMIATTKVAPGRNPDGHAWFRAMAIDVLGEIGSVGQQNAVVSTLSEVAANSETPFVTRCAAARALGKLHYDPNANLPSQELARKMARLAVDALTYEAEQERPDFESMAQSQRSGSTALSAAAINVTGQSPPRREGGGGGLFRNSGQNPAAAAPPPGTSRSPVFAPGGFVSPEQSRLQDEHALMVRRRLLDRVDAVKKGLTGSRDGGVSSLAKAPPQKTYVETLNKRLEVAINLCENDRLGYDELIERIKQEVAFLRKVVDEGTADNQGAEGPPAAEPKAEAGAEAKAAP